MQLTWKSIAVMIIAFGGIAAGAYTLVLQRGPESSEKGAAPAGSSAVTSRQQSTAGPLAPGAEVPADHPQLDSLRRPSAQSQREGKAQADPNAKVTHFRVGERNVKNIFIDGKVVWVATSNGLIRYDTGSNNFRLFDSRDGLPANGVLRVTKLHGRVAAGTAGGGLALFDPVAEKWNPVRIPGAQGAVFVDDMLAAANGDIWIATRSGAYRVQGGDLGARAKWKAYTAANTRGGLPDDRVYALAQGKDGAIWLGTGDGVARFKNGWRHWNHNQGLGAAMGEVKSNPQFALAGKEVPAHQAAQAKDAKGQTFSIAYNPNYVTSIMVDRNGAVWCGTWGAGLARFDGQAWRNYTTADGLPGNHVFTLTRDDAGRLLIGTDKGLAWREGKGFEVLTTANGLISDYVFAVDPAPDGSLWVGSYGGVARLRTNL